MEKEKLSELPLGEELKKLPVHKLVRLIIDMHSQKYEIRDMAAMQVNTFFSEASLILAENILEREARAKEARAYKKHKFDY